MPGQIKDAKISRLEKIAAEEGLFRLKKNKSRGTLTSRTIAAIYPFAELIASANAITPPGSAFSLEIKILTQKGRWSRWYRMGRFSSDGGESVSGQEDRFAAVDVDILKLKNPAVAFRYRVTLEKSKTNEGPTLRLIAVSYTAPASSGSYRFDEPFMGGPVELNVAPRSQMIESPEVARDICSPTSVAMTLEFLGAQVATLNAAQDIQDRESQLFGNWFLNTAYAGSHGFESFTARLNSLGALERFIRSSHPVVISLAFDQGEISGAPLNKTRGHLLVVTGFDVHGNVMVNDPAAPDASSVKRAYNREQFAHAWLGRKNGLSYIIRPRFPQEMLILTPMASLRQTPDAPRPKDASRDACEESQLIAGERARALKAKGDWIAVEALEQERWNESQDWHFYPGWIHSQELAPAAFWPFPDLVVTQKSALSRRAPIKKIESLEPVAYSMGTQWSSLETPPEFSKLKPARQNNQLILLPSFEPGFMSREATQKIPQPSPPSPEKARRAIVHCARQFLDEPYFWGGRSGVARNKPCGIDCSGLVSLSHRCAGIQVPRNSKDQFLRSNRLNRSDVKSGDLIFLSYPGEPQKITHVLIYTGNGRAIEANGDANMVREVSLEERLGTSWTQIDSGSVVNNRSVYFGSFLP
ncbi:MAG: C40 family peptidase [Elusimicrobia bacterium]|nr:C40 family peptidase [Elusimicrobiota bacterium]